jgi:hypothetical protein
MKFVCAVAVYSLYVDAVVLLARYVLIMIVCVCVCVCVSSCQLSVLLLVIVQNNKRCTVQRIKIKPDIMIQVLMPDISLLNKTKFHAKRSSLHCNDASYRQSQSP